MKSCAACKLPVPAEPLDVVAILARDPAGLPTDRIARLLRRRRADVLAELRQAEAEGRIERLDPAGSSHAQRWRLRDVPSEPPGGPRERRQAAGAGVALPEPIPALLPRTPLLLAAGAVALSGVAQLAAAAAVMLAARRGRPGA